MPTSSTAKRQLLFIQGGGAGTHDEWDHKLVASLEKHLGASFEVHYPRMPREDDPSIARWSPVIEMGLRALREGDIAVGHSIGGALLLKVLSEQPSDRKLGAILLVATPFVGDGGWESEELRFSRQLGARLPRGVPVHFFHGLEDDTAPPAHLELYASAIPQAHLHRLPGRDHQLNDDLKEVASTIVALTQKR